MNKRLRFLTTTLLLVIVETLSANTYTLSEGDFTSIETQKESGGVIWTCKSDGGYFSFDTKKNRGFQFGSTKYWTKNVTFSTSGIKGNITSITVNAATSKGGKARLAVLINGINYDERKKTN